jgi:hypothetical protein
MDEQPTLPAEIRASLPSVFQAYVAPLEGQLRQVQGQGTILPAEVARRPAHALAPQVDHHQHLLSPTLAAAWSEPAPAAIDLPAEFHRRLRERAPPFDDPAALADLYTDDAVVSFLDGAGGRWIRGRHVIGGHLAGAFRRQYSLTPVACRVDGSTGYVAGYLSGLPRHFHVLLALSRGGDGAWRVAAQSFTLVPPATLEPVTAERHLGAQLGAGDARRHPPCYGLHCLPVTFTPENLAVATREVDQTQGTDPSWGAMWIQLAVVGAFIWAGAALWSSELPQLGGRSRRSLAGRLSPYRPRSLADKAEQWLQARSQGRQD